MTYQQIYEEQLRLLRQYASATLYPEEFTTLWNKAMMDWVSLRASEDELDEKRNEDLQVLKVVDFLPNVGGLTAGTEKFNLPYSPSTVNTPGNPGNTNFGFLRLQNLAIKGTYTWCKMENNMDYVTMSPWIKDDVKRVADNPFRKPIVNSVTQNIYYEIRSFDVYLHAPDNFVGSELRIDYLRYPQYADLLGNPLMNFELPIYAKDEIASRMRSDFLLRTANPLYMASIQNQKTTVN